MGRLTVKVLGAFSFAAAAKLLLTSSLAAAANLVTNGGFETLPSSPVVNSYQQVGPATGEASLPGWTLQRPYGPAFVGNQFAFTVDPTASGYAARVYASPPGSPAGGHYFLVDGDPVYTDSIEQSISGLTPGDRYTVSFYQASGQGVYLPPIAHQVQWQISLGADVQTTPLMSNAANTSFPWTHETLTFTAGGSGTEILKFLAINGGPGGYPPVALLDGISLTAVPEPTTWAMLVVGTALVGGMMRQRRRIASAV